MDTLLISITLVISALNLAVLAVVFPSAFKRIRSVGTQLAAESVVIKDVVREEVSARTAEIRVTVADTANLAHDAASARHGEIINTLVPVDPTRAAKATPPPKESKPPRSRALTSGRLADPPAAETVTATKTPRATAARTTAAKAADTDKKPAARRSTRKS